MRGVTAQKNASHKKKQSMYLVNNILWVPERPVHIPAAVNRTLIVIVRTVFFEWSRRRCRQHSITAKNYSSRVDCFFTFSANMFSCQHLPHMSRHSPTATGVNLSSCRFNQWAWKRQNNVFVFAHIFHILLFAAVRVQKLVAKCQMVCDSFFFSLLSNIWDDGFGSTMLKKS